MTTKRVLITGGAGFIGGHIAEGLADSGHDVTVLDNLEPYYDLGIKEHTVEAAKQAAEANDGNYELVEASIIDEELVDDLVSSTDVVYHQAAQAGVRKSVDEPRKVNHYNVDGTINVLEAARKHDIDRFRRYDEGVGVRTLSTQKFLIDSASDAQSPSPSGFRRYALHPLR